MRRIVITDEAFIYNEAEAITRLLSWGVERVHIRKPGAKADDVRALVEGVPSDLRKRLSMHDCLELADELGVGGIHVNSRNEHCVPKDFRGLRSRGCHSVEELGLYRDYDYLFLSPVFDSISKDGYRNEGLLQEYVAYYREHGEELPPVIALGGVKPSSFGVLMDTHFAGGAMLGAVWQGVDMRKFRLQYITPYGSGDELLAGAESALAGGCRWVQLRMKDSTTADILSTSRRMASLCRSYGAVFVLDDRVDLVVQSGADGVHLGQNDMPVAQARGLLGAGYIIGATANNAVHIEAACETGADYIGLGPYRFTTTKKNLSPTLGLEGYADVISKVRGKGLNVPIVAIGGLDEDDIEPLRRVGVDGYAISGAIAKAANRTEKTRRILGIINED